MQLQPVALRNPSELVDGFGGDGVEGVLRVAAIFQDELALGRGLGGCGLPPVELAGVAPRRRTPRGEMARNCSTRLVCCGRAEEGRVFQLHVFVGESDEVVRDWRSGRGGLDLKAGEARLGEAAPGKKHGSRGEGGVEEEGAAGLRGEVSCRAEYIGSCARLGSFA